MENDVKKLLSGFMASVVLFAASTASAQETKPLKLGAVLDMSGLFADITGPGSEAAAKMAVEDFGGEVLGRKVQIVVADHLNKSDLAANFTREMIDNQGVEAIVDVAGSATALAAAEMAKARGKIIMFNGPGAVRLTNEACGPYMVHYTYDTYALASVTGLATVKRGLNSLVLPDGGLCVRPGAGARHFKHRHQGRWQGARQRQASDQHLGLLLVPVAGAEFEGQRDRSRQCRRRHHQCHQAGG